jgi:hypothetical protein
MIAGDIFGLLIFHPGLNVPFQTPTWRIAGRTSYRNSVMSPVAHLHSLTLPRRDWLAGLFAFGVFVLISAGIAVAQAAGSGRQRRQQVAPNPAICPTMPLSSAMAGGAVMGLPLGKAATVN